jgi:signal transduction histidine kinase
MRNDNIFVLILIGMSGAFLLSFGIIYTYIAYQKKINKQKREAKKAEMAYQAKLFTATIESQEEERKSIGRELHDDIGSILAMLKYRMGNFHNKEDLSSFCDENKTIIDNLIEKVRNLSHLLLPPELELLGFHEALESLCNKFNVGNNIDISLNDETKGLIKRNNSKISLSLYRIFQELITNTLKHASASAIHIHLQNKDGILIIDYTDNGIGFDDKKIKTDSLGFYNIKSRLLMIGGTHHINTSPLAGFQITIYIDHKSIV